MEPKKILSILGMGCVLLLIIPTCMLAFIVLVGATTWISDPDHWTGEDSTFLIGFTMSLLCVLGIVLTVGVASVYGLFSKKKTAN